MGIISWGTKEVTLGLYQKNTHGCSFNRISILINGYSPILCTLHTGVFKKRVPASLQVGCVCWAMSGWEKFWADQAVWQITRLLDFPDPRFFDPHVFELFFSKIWPWICYKSQKKSPAASNTIFSLSNMLFSHRHRWASPGPLDSFTCNCALLTGQKCACSHSCRFGGKGLELPS